MEKDLQPLYEFTANRTQTTRILVVGDVMLDMYYYGDVTRISPEAPWLCIFRVLCVFYL